MATKLVEHSEQPDNKGYYITRTSYHMIHNAHLIASNDMKPTKLVHPSQLAVARLPDGHEKKATPQMQSSFFSTLPREVREKIFEKMLMSKFTDKYFAEACDCLCEACINRRHDESMGEIFIRTRRPVVRHGPVRNPDLISLFKTCRRVYDEARPILLQVNSLFFDAAVGRMPLLHTIIKPLSTHRGLRLGPAVLSSATFVLSKFNQCGYTSSPISDFSDAVLRAHRAGPYIQIPKLKIIVHLSEMTCLADFEVLLRTLTLFQGVITRRIEIKHRKKSLHFHDYMILNQITRAIQENVLEDERRGDPFSDARELIEDGYQGDIFDKHPSWLEMFCFDDISGFDAAKAASKDFQHANKAALTHDSVLDPRAFHFIPGYKAYGSRTAQQILL